ncbi:MAG: class I SAM-dependent methyltransferase, partial [Candidatus Thorarchaeota archaeon]
IVLHDFDDPVEVLKNARRMLKSTGRLINLDWKKANMDFGPPYARRFSEGQSKNMIEDAGFFVESIKNTGPYHYLIVARKR